MIVVAYGPNQAQMQNPTTPGILQSQLRIWDVKSGRELSSLTDAASFEAGFNPDGRMLATLGSMGQISLWDTASGNRLRELKSSPLGNLGSLTGGAMNPGAINPAAIMRGAGKPGSMPAMPNIADITSMMTNMMGAMSAGTMGRSVTSMAFSRDGRMLATGGVETKSNIDLAAMMGGPQPGQKGQKKPPKNAADPQDIMKHDESRGDGTGSAVGRFHWPGDRSIKRSRQRRNQCGLQSRWPLAGFRQQ